ncbi:hypothetical protein Droror1_Dr00004522 [Drosera rotundifolia]
MVNDGKGVDLNRNWSVDWGKKEKDYDPTEENPGSAPFSEPVSQIMRKLAMTFEPHVWINVHSGMEALFVPYDHKNTTPDGLLTIRMKSILKVLNQRHFHDRCMVGSGGGSVGYLAHGTATDYMYEIEVALSIVGDITPEDGVSKSEKNRREQEALNHMCDLLGEGPRADEVSQLWMDYEVNSSPEAKIVKDFDKV